MAQPIQSIPVEHDPAVYAIEASASDPRPLELTLLELVDAVCEASDDEQEAVATVVYMLRSRRVRLVGNFCGQSPDAFFD